MGTEKYYTVLKILIRFVVAVYQKNNSKSATEKYECPLIEINRYLSLQIKTHKKIFSTSRYSRQFHELYIAPDWGSPHFYVLCTHFQNLVFFFHKLMFLLITFLFISLFNLNRFERNTNKMSNKNLLNLLLPENPLVIFIQKKMFPHWSQKKKNTSLFIITFHCFTVRVCNQLVFRVRRAAICPLLHWTNTITYNNGIKNIFDDEDQR